MAPSAHSRDGGRRVAIMFAAVYAGLYFALYALQFFLPQIVVAPLAWGGGALAASAVAACPYTVAGVAILVWSLRCDRVGARPAHIAGPALAASVAAVCAAQVTDSRTLLLMWVSVALGGIFAAVPAFWSQCTAHLAGPRAALAVAGVNATASLASFAGPYITGYLRDASGSYQLALLAVGGSLALTAAGTLLLPAPSHDGRSQSAGPARHAGEGRAPSAKGS